MSLLHRRWACRTETGNDEHAALQMCIAWPTVPVKAMQDQMKKLQRTLQEGPCKMLSDKPDGLNNIQVERCSLLKCLVQSDLSQLTAHSSLCKLHNCIGCILNTI